MKQPRLAEMVAADLRESIVNGELSDADTLPTLDRLVERFRVSPPSVREALRILENEGLISIRRGNVGGALVHRPQPESAAYMLGLVLQSQRVRATDLEAAILELEPVCASMCARREDRHTAVVPQLSAALDAVEAAVDDMGAFGIAMVSFHEQLMRCSGNQTMILVVVALGTLWAAQNLPWPHRRFVAPPDTDRDFLLERARDYRPLIDAIDRGDAQAAYDIVRGVIDDPEEFRARRRNPVIHATDFSPRDFTTPWTARRAAEG